MHIPQAVQLVECDGPLDHLHKETQLTIPLSVQITESPKLGVITEVETPGACVRVFAEGTVWTVRKENIYTVEERTEL